MPKENINCTLIDAMRIEVGWESGKDVQLGTTNAAQPFVTDKTESDLRFLKPGEDYDGYQMTGWFTTLDRAAINRLIRVLRKARDAAYGADA